MFGHHDDSNQPVHDDDAAAEPAAVAPQTDAGANAEISEQPAPNGDVTQSPAVVRPDLAAPPSEVDEVSAPATQTDNAQEPAWQHPGTPLDDKGQISDVISPAGGFPKRPSYRYPSEEAAPDTPEETESDPVTRELIDVKDHALDDLAPLLDKLDLPPEEKFRAIMTILQANDDKSLVKAAYAAAHSIEDEETRARALYTIVNEVDYFTHSAKDEAAN